MRLFDANKFENVAKFYINLSHFAEEDSREKGKLYKPQNKHEEKFSSTDKATDYAKMLSSSSKKESPASKKGPLIKAQEKKKSNLELFKEELRQ